MFQVPTHQIANMRWTADPTPHYLTWSSVAVDVRHLVHNVHRENRVPQQAACVWGGKDGYSALKLARWPVLYTTVTVKAFSDS